MVKNKDVECKRDREVRSSGTNVNEPTETVSTACEVRFLSLPVIYSPLKIHGFLFHCDVSTVVFPTRKRVRLRGGDLSAGPGVGL